MSDVIDFPASKPPALLIGPFQTYKVVVDGRAIPNLEGYPQEDGRFTLIVDQRFIADFPDEEIARRAAGLIANAMAIAAGYPWFGATSKDLPFAPQISEIVFGSDQ